MGEAAHELPIPESMGDHPHEADSGMHLRRIGEQEPKSGPPGREQYACSGSDSGETGSQAHPSIDATGWRPSVRPRHSLPRAFDTCIIVRPEVS
jgi:hypothetical protein